MADQCGFFHISAQFGHEQEHERNGSDFWAWHGDGSIQYPVHFRFHWIKEKVRPKFFFHGR